MKITMRSVESSLIHSCGYDPETETLQVCFLSKGVAGNSWQYLEVPESVWEEMQSAPSIGKYFLANVKRQYESRRVEE